MSQLFTSGGQTIGCKEFSTMPGKKKGLLLVQFSCSVISDSLRPYGLQHARPLSITSSQSLLKLMSIESVMPSNNLIVCRPLLLPPLIFPSIRVFSNESVLHINSSAFSFLYGPTLTSTHDYWKNHSFDFEPLSAK